MEYNELLELMARNEAKKLIGKKIHIKEKSGKEFKGIVMKIENNILFFEGFEIEVAKIDNYIIVE